ncbi:MAG: NAD(P)-binding protein [Deltaproteobacteria bacterium]|nr:NAD(P)-binding protein [Deltaproteobacteria bacterium]
MTNRNAYDAIIIGAGPNGLLAGAYLAKAGHKVLLCERRHETRWWPEHRGVLRLSPQPARHLSHDGREDAGLPRPRSAGARPSVRLSRGGRRVPLQGWELTDLHPGPRGNSAVDRAAFSS